MIAPPLNIYYAKINWVCSHRVHAGQQQPSSHPLRCLAFWPEETINDLIPNPASCKQKKRSEQQQRLAYWCWAKQYSECVAIFNCQIEMKIQIASRSLWSGTYHSVCRVSVSGQVLTWACVWSVEYEGWKTAQYRRIKLSKQNEQEQTSERTPQPNSELNRRKLLVGVGVGQSRRQTVTRS